MAITADLLDGRVRDPERVLESLRAELLPRCIELLNGEALAAHCRLYDSDHVPVNQRNLTDVRTRMGSLLEFELAKAINAILPSEVATEVALTSVIAHRFPDLAFRTARGEYGVRFEVKAIQTIAEEKAANFDTLIKDIRKGLDFVLVQIWEWRRHAEHPYRFPHLDAIFALDAYALAQIRDCYWLNTPPKGIGKGRQGYDLCFGVNYANRRYNKEEGNYGKLMRVFDAEFEVLLSPELRSSSTLATYYAFKRKTLFLGLWRIAEQVAHAFSDERENPVELATPVDVLPAVILVESSRGRLAIVADETLLKTSEVKATMLRHAATEGIRMNGKFKWSAIAADGRESASGTKPASAIEWATRRRDKVNGRIAD